MAAKPTQFPIVFGYPIYIYIYIYEKDHALVKDQSQKEFDASLVKHIRIKIIDNVTFNNNSTTKEKEKLCEEREGYWQHHLRTFEKFGGMNVLDSNQRFLNSQAP